MTSLLAVSLLCLSPLLPQDDAAPQGSGRLPFEKPVGAQGSISILIETPETYTNGRVSKAWNQNLVELPGVAGCFAAQTRDAVYLMFAYTGNDRFDRGFALALPDLPGPAKYVLQFGWDSEQGRSDGYLNGMPLRLSDVQFDPWEIGEAAEFAVLGAGPNRVKVLDVDDAWHPHEYFLELVPEGLRGQGGELFDFAEPPAPIDVEARRGKLLYETELDEASDVADWIMEGPGELTFADGAMTMRSKTPKPEVRGNGHFNFWCPEPFPDSFVAEWEFAPVEPHGCALFFFAARGRDGQDIFDPALPERQGHYPSYCRGAINNYQIVYFDHLPLFATGRLTSSVVKCAPYSVVSLGPAAVKPGTTDFQKLRVVKDGAHVQLFTNGKVHLDFTDPGTERWGPVLDDGWIALRQMACTVGAYRNFRVWELAAAPKD